MTRAGRCGGSADVRNFKMHRPEESDTRTDDVQQNEIKPSGGRVSVHCPVLSTLLCF